MTHPCLHFFFSSSLPPSLPLLLPLLPCRVWEVTTGEVLNTLIHHNEAVLHLRFANGLMVTCSKDRSIAVWDMASPTDISLRRVLVGHRAAVNVVDFDDKYIVSASGDRTIKVERADIKSYTVPPSYKLSNFPVCSLSNSISLCVTPYRYGAPAHVSLCAL